MNKEEFAALGRRIAARADSLWQDAGRPEGGAGRFQDQARELVALQEVDLPMLDPLQEPLAEEAPLQANLGEFPGLRDQGDALGCRESDADGDPYAHDDIRLSDGDASDTGGVLPEEDVAGIDLPDISQTDADITSSALDADDAPLNDDLNDDGLPDAEDIDDKTQA